ncbi:MAG: hypothetical protein AB8C13_09710 [Phycisphaerales bacterium]
MKLESGNPDIDQHQRRGSGGVIVACLLVGLMVLVFAPVVFGAGQGINSDSIREGFGLIRSGGFVLFLRSLLIAGLISGLAVILGVPLAKLMIEGARGWSASFALVVGFVPLWLPSYALYGAMNLARAPDTLVGNWLVSYSTSSPDRRWVTIWAGYLIAVLGLSLWGSVIAAAVIASGSKRQTIYTDMMDLEPAGIVTRARVWVGMHRGAVARAWGVVGLVMLGSGVPLHLAQLDTWSIVVWRALSERGPDSWGAVWVLGSPMVLIGIAGAWWVTHRVVLDPTSREIGERGHDDVGDDQSQRGAGRLVLILAGVVWVLAAVVPAAVLSVSIDDWRSMGLFWTERRDALMHSGSIGFGVGIVGCMCSAGVACVLGDRSRFVRRVGVGCVFMGMSGALVPGVLVGSSIAGAGGVYSGVIGEFAGLLARVLVIGVVVGAVVAGRERGELVSQRWSVGSGVLGWWMVHGKRAILAYLGAGVLCGLLAVHEIEASVMITRAGVSTMSQGLLADLHYARLERLSAALLNLMGAGFLISLFGGALIWQWNREVAD